MTPAPIKLMVLIPLLLSACSQPEKPKSSSELCQQLCNQDGFSVSVYRKKRNAFKINADVICECFSTEQIRIRELKSKK